MQLISVRSNQDFTVQYENGKLIPQTEIIILIEKPKYIKKGEKLERSTSIEEIRFKTGTNGIQALIGMLEQAERVASGYEKMAGSFNEIIVNSKPIETTNKP